MPKTTTAAFFDVDGTVVKSEMISAFIALAMNLRGFSRLWTMLKLIVCGLADKARVKAAVLAATAHVCGVIRVTLGEGK